MNWFQFKLYTMYHCCWSIQVVWFSYCSPWLLPITLFLISTELLFLQTPWKLLGFYWTEEGFWPDFADINSLRPKWNGCHFADDIFKYILLNENVLISIKISLKFIPKGPINNIPALVQIMAWRRLGDKPLSEPIVVSLLTHICVTRPQWVKHDYTQEFYWSYSSFISKCPRTN